MHEYKEMKSKLNVRSISGDRTGAYGSKDARKIAAERERVVTKVYKSIEEPYNQVQEELKGHTTESNKQVFSYVNAGFHIVKRNCEYIDKELIYK